MNRVGRNVPVCYNDYINIILGIWVLACGAEEAKRKNREMTKKLFSMGMDVQKIADVIDVEPSQVEEWVREDQSEECVIKK